MIISGNINAKWDNSADNTMHIEESMIKKMWGL